MGHNIDWSKSHCGVMLCSYEQTVELMPEVQPILDELTSDLEFNWEDYVVDVKVHMLMPNQFPAIPNWHLDFMPRDENGERTPEKATGEKMYMWLSGLPLTEYKDRKTKEVYTKPPQQWHSFTQSDLHRATMSEIHTWRCFIRVIPKKFIHQTTINVGTKRIHTQVYLDSNKFRW
ncbi:hypothetical protein NVP1170O_123 [Vibrio phage 1.170.O._10N.261.52.C3]|nr:hypothetical protein NVP1170O_123 [Vibrio phage 1.170.O._10N.261.52.C3]